MKQYIVIHLTKVTKISQANTESYIVVKKTKKPSSSFNKRRICFLGQLLTIVKGFSLAFISSKPINQEKIFPFSR